MHKEFVMCRSSFCAAYWLEIHLLVSKHPVVVNQMVTDSNIKHSILNRFYVFMWWTCSMFFIQGIILKCYMYFLILDWTLYFIAFYYFNPVYIYITVSFFVTGLRSYVPLYSSG
jgi:hypothetical protein